MNKFILSCIVLLLGGPIAQAGDAPVSTGACVACHGSNGVSSNPEWPNLAGQKAGYLARQLRAFRDGTRSNPAMTQFVSNLSDADIEQIAAWYAGQAAPTSGARSAAHSVRSNPSGA